MMNQSFDPWAEIERLRSGPADAPAKGGPAKAAKAAKADAGEGIFSRISSFSRAGVPSTESRCVRCLELEAQGVETLYCSRCGYAADRPTPSPTAADLVFPLAYVREQAPDLPPLYREEYEYWRARFLHFGWSEEESERAAFRQALHFTPPRRSRERGQLQLMEGGEDG